VVTETERVGALTYAGNQSLLARLGVEPPARTLLWLSVGGAVVLAAYAHAARARSQADPVAAAVLLGCASLVASPISWPFHQGWLVLAALVLLGRARPGPVALGVVLVVLSLAHTRIIGVTDGLPLVEGLATNAEILGVLAVCVLGLGRPAAQPSAYAVRTAAPNLSRP